MAIAEKNMENAFVKAGHQGNKTEAVVIAHQLKAGMSVRTSRTTRLVVEAIHKDEESSRMWLVGLDKNGKRKVTTKFEPNKYLLVRRWSL